MKNIVVMGISLFIMQSSDSIVSVVMNIGLLKFGGDLYVGAYTILQSVMQILVSGLTQGAQTIISYNYGASKNYRICEAYLLPRITSQPDFIFVAEPISDVTAGIITFIFFMQTYKRLKVK